MLEAMTLLTAAWECVSQETWSNFLFQESRHKFWGSYTTPVDDPFELLDAELEDFQDRSESPIIDFTVDGYVDEDEDVLTSETHVMKDEEAIARVTQSQ